MQINYKNSSDPSNSDILEDEISPFKNTDTKATIIYPRQPAKTDAITREDTAKMPIQPVKKVEFSLERSKRIKT